MPQSNQNKDHRKKALLLEYFTVAYNVVECVVSIVAGLAAGSVALVGFGLDSAIESLSGGVLIWRLRKHGTMSCEEEERVEKKAIKLVAWSFFALGTYTLVASLKKLYFAEIPDPSVVGIVIAVLSIIIMPLLALAKNRMGKNMGLRSLIADSRQTLMCSLLSVALLIGLGANYLYGLWWADPVAALVITALILKEGVSTLKQGKLCTC